jgi:hypothetical protein
MTDAERIERVLPGFFFKREVNIRTLRFLAYACARENWDVLGQYQQEVLDGSERFMVGLIDIKELQSLKSKTFGQHRVRRAATLTDVIEAATPANGKSRYDYFALRSVLWRWMTNTYPQVSAPSDPSWRRLRLSLLDIIRNDFAPVSFNSEWRTDTAKSLARQMYDSRDFGAMPILADALQDAGCEDEHILNHCRDANATHVRGCWVVDLVLGKE